MSDPLFVFLHVHKTAGSTFLANVLRNFAELECVPLYAGPAGLSIDGESPRQGWEAERIDAFLRESVQPYVRLVYGHMAYWGVHETFGAAHPPYYATFLRDPVERVISLYSYTRAFGAHWHNEIVENDWSLEEWLERSSMLWRANGQVRQLLWHEHPEVLEEETLTEAHLAAAAAMLDRYDFVGTTETFARDSRFLYDQIGVFRYHDQEVVRATPDKEDASGAVREHIAQMNELDVRLYELASTRRDAELEFARGDVWIDRTSGDRR
jgi:hypothetical protein